MQVNKIVSQELAIASLNLYKALVKFHEIGSEGWFNVMIKINELEQSLFINHNIVVEVV